MPSKTNNLRDKLEDNELDLSLMQLTEVPVQEIVSTNFVTMTTFVCQDSKWSFCELWIESLSIKNSYSVLKGLEMAPMIRNAPSVFLWMGVCLHRTLFNMLQSICFLRNPWKSYTVGVFQTLNSFSLPAFLIFKQFLRGVLDFCIQNWNFPTTSIIKISISNHFQS